MSPRIGWTVIVVMFVVIIVLAWFLFATPAPVKNPMATSTPPTSTTSTTLQPAALHDRVHITSPASGAKVGQTFSISGEAPGNWYFEAVFTIRVRDADNSKVGQTHGQAQSGWMTTGQVPFTATITLGTAYKGPATLVLLKDNPSGLPENDDAVEIPITIQ